MHTESKMTAVTLSVAVLFSIALFAPDAVAQSRGRSIRTPSISGGGLRAPSMGGRSGRSGGGNLFPGSSRSGFSGLEGLGSLLNSMNNKHGHGGYGNWDRHDDYWDAYRDVGIANAVVDLIGILVNASTYQTYAPVAAAPVEVVPAPVHVVPVPASPPVVVMPAPPVILQTPVYAAPPYVHLALPPRPLPYAGAYPGYSVPRPAPRYSPGYSSGYGHYKAPMTLRNGPGMTPQRTPGMQSSPMVTSRGRTSAGAFGAGRSGPSVQRSPVRSSGRSYRVR